MIVNIDRKSGIVVDINQTYNENLYENREVPDGTVPKDFRPRIYKVGPDGEIAESRQTRVAAQYAHLGNGESLGELRAHENDQLIFVLHGQLIVVADGRQSILNSGNSQMVGRGTPLLITGNTDRSVFITVQT
jgi:quercetin dioxygenase-like cupin family protein